MEMEAINSSVYKLSTLFPAKLIYLPSIFKDVEKVKENS